MSHGVGAGLPTSDRGRRPYTVISLFAVLCERYLQYFLRANRQRASSLAGRVEDGIGDRRIQADDPNLTNALYSERVNSSIRFGNHNDLNGGNVRAGCEIPLNASPFFLEDVAIGVFLWLVFLLFGTVVQTIDGAVCVTAEIILRSRRHNVRSTCPEFTYPTAVSRSTAVRRRSCRSAVAAARSPSSPESPRRNRFHCASAMVAQARAYFGSSSTTRLQTGSTWSGNKSR
jgi:hypothetical protein